MKSTWKDFFHHDRLRKSLCVQRRLSVILTVRLLQQNMDMTHMPQDRKPWNIYNPYKYMLYTYMLYTYAENFNRP